jgi:LacI family transcriptional regulator
MRVRDHRERLDGFHAAIAAMPITRTVLPVLEGQDDPDLSFSLISDCLAANPTLAGIYNLGAGNRGLIKALSARGRADLCVIAHELTAETRAALETGLVDAVLNQDAGHEVRSAIRVLRAKADGLPVISAQERIRLDIFIKDNLPAGPDEDEQPGAAGN